MGRHLLFSHATGALSRRHGNMDNGDDIEQDTFVSLHRFSVSDVYCHPGWLCGGHRQLLYSILGAKQDEKTIRNRTQSCHSWWRSLARLSKI
ncbi:hypothetical protein IFVP182_C2120207 [Vibrio parahaemolyticus]